MGLRPQGSNPCLAIRRYRRKGRPRFLSDEEMRRLSARLSAHAGTSPQQVAVVPLLLLTGCRKERDPDAPLVRLPRGSPFLRDSKTVPRTAWLSQPARDVLDGLEWTGQWVFPTARGRGPRNKGWLEGFWDEVRAEAGLRGVRLHDLRHTCALKSINVLVLWYFPVFMLHPQSHSHRIDSIVRRDKCRHVHHRPNRNPGTHTENAPVDPPAVRDNRG